MGGGATQKASMIARKPAAPPVSPSKTKPVANKPSMSFGFHLFIYVLFGSLCFVLCCIYVRKVCCPEKTKSK